MVRSLELEQEDMRYRWSKEGKQDAKDANKESDFIEAMVHKTGLICQSCNVNPTTVSTRTGQLLACKWCYNKRISLFKNKLTLKQYFGMVKFQKGKCHLCRKVMEPPYIGTGKDRTHVFGLICMRCKQGIDLFDRDKLLVQAVVNSLISSDLEVLGRVS
jgi:hypothetical protein